MANPKMVKQWFSYAIRDLKAAKALYSLGPDYKNIVAFNCQQCVEKAIKGYLVFHGVRPAKTHVIRDLARMAGEVDGLLGKRLHKADKLTDFAVAYRYPDSEKRPLTMKQASAAVKLAQKVYDDLFLRVQE